MNSLIIGSSSQLAHYFPEEYERIDSRFIRDKLPLPLKAEFYDRVYICFAEQRTFLENAEPNLFRKTNDTETLKVINFFKDKCNKIVVYGTAELWNNYEGPINIDMPFNYHVTDYILSKEQMVVSINSHRHYNEFSNVIILHPVNFNSRYRKSGFLFSKIFDSLINKNKIEIGDTYFYRDLVHPEYVVERSILAEKDEIVGSGRLVFVNDFIRDLYYEFRMNYEEYVTENTMNNIHINKIYYLDTKECLYPYGHLWAHTIRDIRNARLQDKIS